MNKTGRLAQNAINDFLAGFYIMVLANGDGVYSSGIDSIWSEKYRLDDRVGGVFSFSCG